MKLKSECSINGIKHRAISATKSNAQRALSQIKSIIID